ncbi:putative entry exclusion protein TrbK-alt [Bradyrhizobium vignae]|uniref:Entry exclusion protein TrbK-alt n=1 Tax=Bradyrhizobium vignae TaxID=1549949 RepID=A0ABS4A1Y6_9BRAD|nr:putative entry exclusion protein TrbK-alt [Bradyrhizobium vignae]MBP0114422.1 putative entry exclusion protein TrbK-alt [Bradyrhizobium vignae]
MNDIRAFKALSLLATIVVLVVTACTIQLRGGEDAPRSHNAEQTIDATSSDLARCRSVTAEETVGYQHCRQLWAENRRRFFGKKTHAAVPDQEDPAAGLAPAPKDQSRIPQGYPQPQPATPEANRP